MTMTALLRSRIPRKGDVRFWRPTAPARVGVEFNDIMQNRQKTGSRVTGAPRSLAAWVPTKAPTTDPRMREATRARGS